jgi:hypothetical protein
MTGMSEQSFNPTPSAEGLLATNLQPPRRLGGATGRGFMPGKSGNPRGRPPAPVDIAALARVHGPRCIEVAVELLDDPDSRIRLGALTALLDRGFGRPKQTIETPDGNSPSALHLLAAQLVSQEILAAMEHNQPPPVIDATVEKPNGKAPVDLLSAPLPIE